MYYYYHQNAMHISRIDLSVRDIKRSVKFYTNKLGFSVLNQNKEYVSLTANHQDELVRLYENKAIKNSQNMNIYHFALLLPTRKDLSKFLRHLITEQIEIDGAADHLVSEAIYLRDPDGFGIEVACDKDDSGWNFKDEVIEMDTKPFDYKGVYYASNEFDFFSNLPVNTVIGHLHLQVNDINSIKAFYQDIIGFNITNDKIYDAVFMGDKNYHHHLAINSWFSDTRVTDDEPQLRCFTITYPSCEKYLYTLEKLKQANITYQETPEGIYIKDPENTCIYLKI